MNNFLSWLEHFAISLVLGISAYLLAKHIDAKMMLIFVGSLFFFAREHAQNEYEVKKEIGADYFTWEVTLRALMFWRWDKDSMMDFASAVLAGFVLLIFLF